MATQLQIRRGTSAQVAAFTGAEGEVVVNTTNDSVHVNDGSTAGGFEVARADGSNWAITNNITTTSNIDVGTVTADALTVDTNTLVVDATNNRVGIGNSSPSSYFSNASNLVVGGTTGANGMTISGSTDTQIFFADGTSGADAYRGIIRYSHADNGFSFWTDGTRRLDVDSSGNLLVGTTSTTLYDATSGGGIMLDPNGPTTIARSGTALYVNRTSTDGNIVQFRKDGTTVGSIGTKNGDLYLGTNDTGLFFADDVNRIIPANASNGNLTNDFADLGDPNYKFKDLYLSGQAIAGDGSVTAPSFRGTDTNTGIYFPSAGVTAISRNGVEGCRMDASGNLNVGFTSFSSMGSNNTGGRLSADGTTNALARGSNGVVLYLYSGSGGAGNITVTGNTASYNTSSDQRLKENIADADDAGSKVDAIQVRKFDWISDGSHQDYGMVAQELQTVAPEAVSQSEDPEEMMGVDYSKLVPMLVKEIQSLRARVAQLEN